MSSPFLVPPIEQQGIAWDTPTEGRRPSLPEETEPLYATPRKEHHAKFTLDNFILHKMLGKGSFGKVKQKTAFMVLSMTTSNLGMHNK